MKKKVFLFTEQGSSDPKIDLFRRDFYYRDFEPIAIVSILGGGGQLGIDSIPREILIQFPIILLEPKDLNKTLDLFSHRRIPLKNLILWNALGNNQQITTRESDVTVTRIDGLEFHCRDDSERKEVDQILALLQLVKKHYKISPAEYENAIGRFLFNGTRIKMDWKDPRTFQEKIQWLKLYDSTPLKTLCADKFRVREYVARKIGAEYLIPLLGVWEDPDEIDFDQLPERFVLKANHGSGMNIVVSDKSKLDTRFAIEKLKAWLAIDFGMFSFELHYCRIPRKIIAEEFLANDPPDYKFFCFDGAPQLIQFNTERSTHLCHDYFDLNWNKLEIKNVGHPKSDQKFSKPKHLEKMIELAKKLAADFQFVRIDFYDVDGKIYFGELTFTPGTGTEVFSPPEWNLKLGSMIKLPHKSKKFNPFEK